MANSHLAHELTSKRVDNARYGGRLALANEVEIKHALHRTWLQTTADECQHVHPFSRSRPRDPYYTKQRVLSLKSVWLARGLNGRLGATKRRMLSFAEGPELELLVPLVVRVDPAGGPFVAGAAEGMIPRIDQFCIIQVRFGTTRSASYRVGED